MKRSWGKVAIGCRCGVGADPLFLQSWTKLLVKGRREGDGVLIPIMELPRHYAAEVIGNMFLRGPADSVLYVDDDMVFEPEMLSRLRDHEDGKNFDILSGVCCSRSAPNRPLVPELVGDTYLSRARHSKTGVVEAGYTGLAFTLIRREVFEAVRRIVGPEKMMFQWGSAGESEDAFFCEQARLASMRIGVCMEVEIGHRIKTVAQWNGDEQVTDYIGYVRGFGDALPSGIRERIARKNEEQSKNGEAERIKAEARVRN